MSIALKDARAVEDMCIKADGKGTGESDIGEEEIRRLSKWWSAVMKHKFGL